MIDMISRAEAARIAYDMIVSGRSAKEVSIAILALPTVPATTTLSPQPDIQQIIDYLDAAQYYFPEGDPDRVALKAASNILVHGPATTTSAVCVKCGHNQGTYFTGLCAEQLCGCLCEFTTTTSARAAAEEIAKLCSDEEFNADDVMEIISRHCAAPAQSVSEGDRK